MTDHNTSALTPTELGWWSAYAGQDPTLILRCGIDKCGKAVGHVHCAAGGADALVVLFQNLPNSAVPEYRPGVSDSVAQHLVDADGTRLSDMIAERRAHADRQTLFRIGNGLRMTRRWTGQTPDVYPLDLLCVVVCPVHDAWGLVDPAATAAHIRRKLAESTVGAKRSYMIFPDSGVLSDS